jgi:hypothetical protein
MILQTKTLERLRLLINEETEYRSGPKLVEFFNALGFKDTYAQGFPSRWAYTDEKLSKINGTPEIDKCIKNLFAPVNFIGRYEDLDNFIKDFNQYLAFDKWKIVRNGTEISFSKADKVDTSYTSNKNDEDEFLKREFSEVSLNKIGVDSIVTDALELRLDEIKKCLSVKAPLSAIFLIGSTLEGILLGTAIKYPREFNQSISAPKDKEGKTKQFQDWTLSNFIDTAHETGFLLEDVKKFSHVLRDFRNYIHPYQQISSKFNPDIQTAKICWQVLRAAIFQITEKKV